MRMSASGHELPRRRHPAVSALRQQQTLAAGF
jgi:hypothetical protein